MAGKLDDSAASPVDSRIAVKVEGVDFTYPTGTHALGDLDLEISHGQTTAIVGPSGCGKSTMLRVLTGFEQPQKGTVTLNIEHGGDKRHPMTMVFQHDTLLPWLTVRENVSLYYRFNGKRKDSLDRVNSLIKMVHLEQFADAYPKQLSGGMRRRVAFLTGVAPQPQILLLDEPFSSVDEPTRVRIHQDVYEIGKRLKMTTVIVTHDLAEAITLSNRVVIFSPRPGRVATTHEIPFGEDRNILELRKTPEFLELYGKLWNDLSEQIAKTRPEQEDVLATIATTSEVDGMPPEGLDV
jgi:NitT/TauT family transport system ATP-binding protein